MLTYRPDIDGLRAISVISVLLYHLDKTVLPGGFVGVDIFFVISGYLITKLIVKELNERAQFRFGNFYLRRVRRLFPAMFTTFALCLVLGAAVSAPGHLAETAESLLAALFSVSNIYFWNVADYFDSDSALKPLLHTWSLSVEEQFYLIWPALLAGLYTLRNKLVMPAVVITLGLLSLLLNLWWFNDQAQILAWFAGPEGQTSLSIQSTAFYWLPFRVFEFCIGAALVWTGTLADQPSPRAGLGEGLFVAGLLLVLASVSQLDDKLAFPSWIALLPCVGGAMMIYAGPAHQLASLITNRWMVGIGLISYSLYLVHWPLIVYYRYWSGRAPEGAEQIGLAALSLVMAVLMYRFIEQPWRKVKTAGPRPNRPFVVGTIACAIAASSISINAFASGGWLWRYPAEVVAQLQYKKGDYTEFFWREYKRLENREFANSGKPRVIIIGDSMAADLVNVLVAAQADQQLDLVVFSVANNCKGMFPLSDESYRRIYAGGADVCRAEHRKIMDRQAQLASADTVILASYWWEIAHLKHVIETADWLKSIGTPKVSVLGLKNQINNGIWFLHQNAFDPRAHELRTPPSPHALEVNRRLRAHAKSYDYFDLLDLFCDDTGCQRITEDGYVVVFDDSHLSENGVRDLAAGVPQRDWFQRLLNSPGG